MRELEEILKSVMEAEPGKLARTVQEALEETGSARNIVYGLGILGAAIANIDERLHNELDKIKGRLARLEEAMFGMTYDEAQATVNSYIEAVKENPDIEASEQVKKAERIIGV